MKITRRPQRAGSRISDLEDMTIEIMRSEKGKK